MGCEAQLAWKCPFTPTFLCFGGFFPSKIGYTDQGFDVSSRFIRLQDYTFLSAVVMICGTTVDPKLHFSISTHDLKCTYNANLVTVSQMVVQQSETKQSDIKNEFFCHMIVYLRLTLLIQLTSLVPPD